MTSDNYFLMVGAGILLSIGYLVSKYLFMFDYSWHDFWIVPTILFGWPGLILLLSGAKVYCQAKRWEELQRERAKIINLEAHRAQRGEE